MENVIIKRIFSSTLFMVGLISTNIHINAATQTGMTNDGYTLKAYNVSYRVGKEKFYEWSTSSSIIVNRISIT